MSTYTSEQMQRRQQSRWTLVQIIGAPIQLLFFFVSGGFVIYTLLTGQGAAITNAMVIVKVIIMYFMCITGMLWEHDVFGHYYFAPEFFWEDAVTSVVMLTHTLFIVGLLFNASENTLLTLIVIAYLSYLFNAGQYFWKFLKNRLKRNEIMQGATGGSKND